MGVSWLLASRFIRKRSSPLLTSSSRAALTAVSLGVAALVVVLALMSGYREALREGILAASGHLLLVPTPGTNAAFVARQVNQDPDVAATSRTWFLAGFLAKEPHLPGEMVTVKAVERWPPFVVPLPPHEGGGPLPVAVGEDLARQLGVRVGDGVFLQVAGASTKLVYLSAQVMQVFSSGFSELRERWVFCSFAGLQRRAAGLGEPLVEVFLREPELAEAAAERLAQSLDHRVAVYGWSDMNRQLFAALRWQKLTLALVLSLIVGVGAFEVASALVVLITEKRQELGVLLAMGASPRTLRLTVLLAGGLVGVAGVVAGLGLGLGVVGVCSALEIPRFSPELAAVYMVSRIPWRVEGLELVGVAVAATAEVLIASLLASRPLAARQPAEVLRWT
ncbi:MAG: ABC transporter permease [Thermoanaerobaculum sp.]|nr:ABC transporter permease [Thermoanaerobaculum sp.]